jgi:molybdopterin/thiamine biosynthesis adenylyltransferase
MSDAVGLTPRLDTQRHHSLFIPTDFRNYGHHVAIVGLDEVGARLARHLTELGIAVKVFDPSPPFATARTVFGTRTPPRSSRAEAIQEILERDTGIQIEAVSRWPEPSDSLGNFVFLCERDEAVRNSVLERFHCNHAGIDLLVDTSKAGATRKVFSLEPRWRREIGLYRQWHETTSSAVGNEQYRALPIQLEFAASVAAFQLIRWFANYRNFSGGLPAEDLLSRLVDISLPDDSLIERWLEHFEPSFNSSGLRVSVIGAGALGSRVVRQLASLGISSEVFDFDSVEAHNIPNQAFGLGEVGMRKTDALRRVLQRDFRINIQPRPEKFDGSQSLGQIVFVCPDNMSARSAVWNNVRLREDVALVVEGRMAETWGKIYSVFPRQPSHLREYEQTLHGDAVASDQAAPACRASISVGPTAECIASHMVWQLVRWFAHLEPTRRSAMSHEIFVHLRPHERIERSFG